MSKREHSPSTSSPSKKPRPEAEIVYRKIATAEAAAKVDAHPPLDRLLKALKANQSNVSQGEAVIYWMRMEDMRRRFQWAILAASIDTP
jgi:deoxyribodipyrimidine photo-lyase